MKNYSLCFVAVLSLTGCKNSQPSLNDTGITWGGNYPNGLNAECIGETIEEQDCSYGRDFTHNNDSDGHAGFSFTKLDSNGNPLLASSEEWSCVKDKVTGLVWEVKSDDGGIHDRDNKYRWGGLTAQGTGYGVYYDDWNSLVEGANEENLCGYSNWRVPTRLELRGITDLSRLDPAIDSDYFPNTQLAEYWASTPTARYLDNAWYVRFSDGIAISYHKRDYQNYVRLVRGK